MLPREIVTNRDQAWSGQFWREVCTDLGIKRLLSISYHPQTNGQIKNLNQTLEIALRAYISKSLDNWSELLTGFTLSYNTSTHTSTGFAPAFLLRGFHPRTTNTMIQINRKGDQIIDQSNKIDRSSQLLDPELHKFTDHFIYLQNIAQDSLILAQAYQRKYYNEGHTLKEFEVGNQVLINLHSL